MNRKKVDELLPRAACVLKEVNIVDDKTGTIKKAYRGQISTFGAAIANGSLLSAIAFFSNKGSSSVDRTLLMTAIYKLIQQDNKEGNLFEYVKSRKGSKERETKEEIINAATALKLAMNLYTLEGGTDE